MFQFGSTSVRFIKSKIFSGQNIRYLSINTIVCNSKIERADIDDSSKSTDTKEHIKNADNFISEKQSNLVAAAFASLKSVDNKTLITPSTTKIKQNKRYISDETIEKATTVNALLEIADASVIPRRLALKVVSILADWSTQKKIKLNDFETDPRFQKLCRILGRTTSVNTNLKSVNRMDNAGDDLSTVLGVTGDDEAAKLIASISLSQMIKVLSTLAQKNRRSTPLLRSLSNNITKSNDKLDLKQSADVLYAAATLTFPDIPLLDRASSDLIDKLNDNVSKSSIVGSVINSVGILRYKNSELLDALSDWIVKHHEICRPQDIFSLFYTLAMVNYRPNNFTDLCKILIPQLSIADVLKSSTWVDYVWSLAVLNVVSNEHIETVLQPYFISRLNDENCFSIALRIKLLNIQAVATTLINNYSGPLITENTDITTVTVVRSREKQLLVAAMLDALSNLLPSVMYLKSNFDTGMGFLIDGECLIDNNCNPLPVSEKSDPNGIKVAFMAYDYHDLIRSSRFELNGINSLTQRLLKKAGYNIVPVPFTEFNPRDKLIKRVQYLEKQLKVIVKSQRTK